MIQENRPIISIDRGKDDNAEGVLFFYTAWRNLTRVLSIL
jgi:hypothetical protein